MSANASCGSDGGSNWTSGVVFGKLVEVMRPRFQIGFDVLESFQVRCIDGSFFFVFPKVWLKILE